MMLGRKADLGLVAEHLLGSADLADVGESYRPLDVGQLLDRRIETGVRIGRELGVHAESLAREQAVEALRSFGRRGRGLEERLDRARTAACLLGPRGPVERADSKLALLRRPGDLLECARSSFAIAH